MRLNYLIFIIPGPNHYNFQCLLPLAVLIVLDDQRSVYFNIFRSSLVGSLPVATGYRRLASEDSEIQTLPSLESDDSALDGTRFDLPMV